MIRKSIVALALSVALPCAALAQDGTLADVRQELTTLYVDVQSLKAEMTSTGELTMGTVGNTPLERLDSISAQLQVLTSKTEELEFRINRIVQDGTNRIGDLEFRLCELEESCDIATLGDTPSLGGNIGAGNQPVAQEPIDISPQPEMAMSEQSDFDNAVAAMEEGDFEGAAQMFESFTNTYPGSTLSQQAHYFRGESYESLGRMTDAARAYLDAYSTDQNGVMAPDAMFKLGMSLGAIGQTQDACVTLQQVGLKFPGSEAVYDAEAAMQNLSCQ